MNLVVVSFFYFNSESDDNKIHDESILQSGIRILEVTTDKVQHSL